MNHNCNRHFIYSEEEVLDLAKDFDAKSNLLISFDTETNGLAPMIDEVVGIGLCCGNDTYYIPTIPTTTEYEIPCESLSENPKSTLKNKSEVSSSAYPFSHVLANSSINQVENQDFFERCELKNALTENQETGSPGWLEPTAQSLRNQQKVSTKYQHFISKEAIKTLFTSLNKHRLVAHNWVFDAKFMYTNFGIWPNLEADTMVMLRVMGKPAKLKEAMEVYLGWDTSSIKEFKELMQHHFGVTFKSKGKSAKDLPIEGDWGVGGYCMDDTVATRDLYLLLKEGIDKHFKSISKIEHAVLPIAAELSLTGVPVDKEALEEAAIKVREYLDSKIHELRTLFGVGFLHNSAKDVREALYGKLGLTPLKYSPKTREPSADKESLDHQVGNHPIIEVLLEVRELEKLLSTYLTKIPTNVLNGRIYSNFNSSGADSGRWTSSSEDTHRNDTFGTNLQAISKKELTYTNKLGVEEKVSVRKSFRAPEGYTWVRLDYHQIEPRVQANLSQEPFLIESFKNGYDSHTTTAALAFDKTTQEIQEDTKAGGTLRKKGKIINLALSYGMGPKSLSEKIDCTMQEAATFLQSFWAKIPHVRDKMETCIALAKDRGCVRTHFGKVRYLGLQDNADAQKVARQSWNTVIQGTAADILKIGMIRLHKCLKENPGKAELVLTVHDEVDLIVKNEFLEEMLPKIRRAFEIPVPENWIAFPADVGFGGSWCEKTLKNYTHSEPENFTSWGDVLGI